MPYRKSKYFYSIVFLMFLGGNSEIFGQDGTSYSAIYDDPYGQFMQISTGIGIQGERAAASSFHVNLTPIPGRIELNGRFYGNVFNLNTDDFGFQQEWGVESALLFAKKLKENAGSIHLGREYVNANTDLVTTLINVGNIAASRMLTGGIWGRTAGNNVDMQHIIFRSGDQMLDPSIEGKHPLDITTMGVSFGLGKLSRFNFSGHVEGYGNKRSTGFISRGWEILYLVDLEWHTVVADGMEFEILERQSAIMNPWGARWHIEMIARNWIFMRINLGVYPGYYLDPVGSIDFGFSLGMGR